MLIYPKKFRHKYFIEYNSIFELSALKFFRVGDNEDCYYICFYFFTEHNPLTWKYSDIKERDFVYDEIQKAWIEYKEMIDKL